MLLLAACLLPSIHLSTSATDATTEVSVLVAPTLSVALGHNSLNLDLVQSQSGSFDAAATSLSVSTNAANGYSIYLYAEDGNPNLVSTTLPTSPSIIAPVTDRASSTTFAPNTWGYALAPAADAITPDNATYHPVSAAADTVA